MIARLQTAEGIAPIQERLRDRYPYMTLRQETAVQVPTGPGGQPPAITGGLVYELADDDGRIVTIGGGSATLSVGAAYEGVEEFAERMEVVLTALTEEARVPRCDRLGARYLTVVALPPGHEAGWKEWFRRELLPATLDEDGIDALDGHHDAGTTNDRNDRSAVLGCCAGGGRWATRAGTGAQ